MKKLHHLSLFILHFQIILFSSMNRVEALDANPNKQALLSFKSTVSDPQNALSDWNSSSSHCTWFGVTCTSNRTSVQSLHLPGVGLSGIIPPHLFNLTSLQVLDLSNNSFQGQIPAGLSHCYNLREINLRRNQLVGSLPSQLGHLSRLKFMDVYANNLSGAIPPTFGNLTSLTHLNLGRNNFRDEIPKELGNLHNLVLLRLSENQFSGQIPNSLYNISSLSFLSLTQNHLVGKLPTDVGLALPNLRQLLLAENSFEGLIPSSLNNASEIQFLDLSSNLFQGSIPFLGNMKKLIMLNLGVNNLSSTTELNLQVFDSLTNCTLLESLILNSNKLAGNLPSSVANLSAHLQHFCIESNLFTGKLPRGIDKFQSLISLTMQQNLFTGELPNSIGRLNKLQRIFVHENMFSGEIPNVFGNLTQLYMLTLGYNQFSGRIPVSIGECQQLNTLGLSWNRLNGSIPIEIFSLSGLSKLWLEKNSLQGSLPVEVGSLKQLSLLNVSDNQLSGNITETIGNCLRQVPSSGVFMNLSWDSLQGNDMLCGSDQEVAGKLRLHTCSTKKKQSKHFGLTISIAVVGFTLLMCVIFYSIWALVSRRRKKKGTKESFFSRPFKGFPEKMSYFDIRLATNSFAAENLIGEGGFGSVYKGVLRTGEDGAGTTLAIKVLDLQQRKASQSFYAECEALRNIQHRNLVKVITSCSSIDHTGGEFKALVMEFMSNGSLYNWLNPEDSQSRSSLTLIQRLNIAIDVASAMDYLHHDCDPPIVHCDLKPGNVLLDDDMAAHVGDFGLARFLSQNPSQSESSTIGLKGSIGYIAPEYGLGGKASTNGDVYSFGILLLEIFTARKPTDEIFQQGLNQKKYALAVQANQVSEIVDPGIFSHTNSSELSPFISSSACSNHSSTSSTISVGRNKNEECLAAIIRVGLCCADHSPSDRLTIRETLTKLQEIRKFLLEL
ncbi:putative LRR receptor-like serine/threonine-protein kinase [Vitis vinifera]|uniref:non-specific serine/threonine protein kinase n=1 Tax=Vitis vinifera TaxID=29760 RepID=A0A438HKL5_VITVI|nr:putative LRR receptor-like serine/threonine-protein kinase [Vitis vinifera]